VYSATEARWLYVDTARLGTTSLQETQYIAGMFMVYLYGFITGTPANLGPNVGSGPLQVTSEYTLNEDALLRRAATGFNTTPQGLQRSGVALLAYLFGLSP
jgi:hypothetical protein